MIDYLIKDETLTGVADVIREHTQSTDKIKPEDFPSAIDDVHTAGVAEGRSAQESDFWDSYQNKGKRVGYQFAFAGEGWNDETFKPKYNMNIQGYSSTMFQASSITDLVGILETQGVTMDFSKNTGSNYLFAFAKLTHIPRVDCSSSTEAYQLFYYCQGLHTVDALVCHKGLSLNQAFYQCTALENIVFEGVIDYNGLNLQWSTKLTHASLRSLIDHLENKIGDTSGTEWKVTIGATNYAKLSQDEILIAVDKGWSIE